MSILCQNDVVSTLMRRNHIAAMLMLPHFYVICLLGGVITCSTQLFFIPPDGKKKSLAPNISYYGVCVPLLLKSCPEYKILTSSSMRVQIEILSVDKISIHTCIYGYCSYTGVQYLEPLQYTLFCLFFRHNINN